MIYLKLAQLMEARRINTKQLSEMTGIRWNTVDDLVKNKAKHWSPENLEKIMVALDVEDVSELIGYEGKAIE
ncbi:helix-turn-helix domain-containing protein [Paenibacillus aurantiacus]|uniref:Helix-turn-helix domain-containing protein n=1 Tax=Paenibacillus aurantiacus TaxID=1936118 RepID=A0ABV5KP61_9BACL